MEELLDEHDEYEDEDEEEIRGLGDFEPFADELSDLRRSGSAPTPSWPRPPGRRL